MQKIGRFIKKYVPTFTRVSLIIALLSIITLVIASHSYGFADFVNSTVSTAFRFLMAKLTQLLPFSLFEMLMYLLLPGLVGLIVIAFVLFRTKLSRVRYAMTLLGVVAVIYSGYVFALAIPYNVTPLNRRLDLEYTEITAEKLYDVSELLLTEVNTLAERIDFDENGPSEMPYSLDELSAKICEAYASLSEKHGFIQTFSSRAKPVLTDGAMSSVHLLGIYTYFTGESNINVEYPDFTIPFTVAHEFAHQRGIIRENEANFIAFLVCAESDDDYIRYSGYLGLYRYVASSLYSADKELYYELLGTMDARVRRDLIADAEISEKYKDSLYGKITRSLNDMYLKMNGTEGVVSYGLVTRLAVAYYEGE